MKERTAVRNSLIRWIGPVFSGVLHGLLVLREAGGAGTHSVSWGYRRLNRRGAGEGLPAKRRAEIAGETENSEVAQGREPFDWRHRRTTDGPFGDRNACPPALPIGEGDRRTRRRTGNATTIMGLCGKLLKVLVYDL